jgi:hypothetical protein
MVRLLPLTLTLGASALATERVQLLSRQDCSQVGYVDCGSKCMPPGNSCCGDGIYCRPGTYCVVNGCCPIGEVCTGPGGTITEWFDVTTTATLTGTTTVTDDVEPTEAPPEDSTTTATSSTSSRPGIPTSSESQPTQSPTESTPVPPVFTGGQSGLRPGVGAVAGLIAGAVLL